MSIQAPPLLLMERLAQLCGQPITVYLKGVTSGSVMEATSSQDEAILPPRPPLPPCPPPEPMFDTLVIVGILVAVGANYISVRVGAGMECRIHMIPFDMIGLIIPMAMPL